MEKGEFGDANSDAETFQSLFECGAISSSEAGRSDGMPDGRQQVQSNGHVCGIPADQAR